MNFIQNALTHWKTSTGGVAAAIGIFAAAYQPGMDWKHWLLAGGAALGAALLGLSAPDASKTARGIGVLLLCLLCSGVATAQQQPADVTTMFAVKTSALNLHLAGQNNPGTDINASYTFIVKGNKSFQAVTDNLLVPGLNFQGYYGGAGLQYNASSLFAKTTLPQNSFQLYGDLEGGIARNVPATGTAVSKPSFYAHAGLNYDPTHSGKFTLNIVDAGYVYATNLHYPTPGANGYTISLGIKIGLWTKQ